MSLKKCEKCGEDVDVAKAFCPECGNPFVHEEKRQGATEFDKYAGTMVFSKSAYNMMLGKMDLDTSRSPEEENRQNPVQNPVNDFPPQNKTPDQNKKSAIIKWVIIGTIAAVIFFFVIVAILIAVFIYFYK
jgi:uncharacterized membrane protein YvbJ